MSPLDERRKSMITSTPNTYSSTPTLLPILVIGPWGFSRRAAEEQSAEQSVDDIEASDLSRHPLCRWGDASASGLPDGCEAFEELELWRLQRTQREGDTTIITTNHRI